jgi:putative ABC transport system substrate-binding protein
VESFLRPGGMITGFTNFEASMGSKWLELMHDIDEGRCRSVTSSADR